MRRACVHQSEELSYNRLLLHSPLIVLRSLTFITHVPNLHMYLITPTMLIFGHLETLCNWQIRRNLYSATSSPLPVFFGTYPSQSAAASSVCPVQMVVRVQNVQIRLSLPPDSPMQLHCEMQLGSTVARKRWKFEQRVRIWTKEDAWMAVFEILLCQQTEIATGSSRLLR
jgi:hypothetical protein